MCHLLHLRLALWVCISKIPQQGLRIFSICIVFNVQNLLARYRSTTIEHLCTAGNLHPSSQNQITSPVIEGGRTADHPLQLSTHFRSSNQDASGMHPAPSDGHWEGELEMSISILCHVLNETGQVWTDTDKPRVDTLSTQTKAIARDKWQAALMPYLTTAQACGSAQIVRGGSDTHVHARPYGNTGLAP